MTAASHCVSKRISKVVGDTIPFLQVKGETSISDGFCCCSLPNVAMPMSCLSLGRPLPCFQKANMALLSEDYTPFKILAPEW